MNNSNAVLVPLASLGEMDLFVNRPRPRLRGWVLRLACDDAAVLVTHFKIEVERALPDVLASLDDLVNRQILVVE